MMPQPESTTPDPAIYSEPNWATYVDCTAQVVGLPIPNEYRPSIIQNFERIAAMAQLVNDFQLSEQVEIAPKFIP
jgi:Protein of unknown function (DUF4089)